MPTPRRRHHLWSVGLAVVALLLVGLAPGAHGGSWHSPPAARAVLPAGHVAVPAAARAASLSHMNALAPTPQHLDLTATPAAEPSSVQAGRWLPVVDAPTQPRQVTTVIPHGRAPPAL